MCCDVLKNKTVVFDGDSICHATTEPKPYRGWAYRIGTKYDMDWHNFGIGGGTITTELYYASGEPRHWVCRSIDSIHEQFPTLDYLILEGGTNDAWVGAAMGEHKYGEWRDEDFQFFRPSLSYVLNYVKQHHPASTIVFMLNDGLSADINASVKTICDHYGVHLLSLHNIAKESGHPSAEGMVQIKSQLEEFVKAL
jgi:lysophospholipase L1-like esterase